MSLPGSESLTAEAKAELIVSAAFDLKAERPVVLDVRELTSFAEVFVLLGGRSDRHVRSIADAIEKALKDRGERAIGSEGTEEGRWILLDYSDVIVHVFGPEARELYDLERLWGDAPRLPVPGAEPAAEPHAEPRGGGPGTTRGEAG